MNKSEFFKSAKDLIKTKEVETPSGKVIVRGMSAGERDDFEQIVVLARQKDQTPKDIRARIAVACVVDEHGKKVFAQSDIAELSSLPAYVLDPILEAALELSGLNSEAIAEAKKN